MVITPLVWPSLAICQVTFSAFEKWEPAFWSLLFCTMFLDNDFIPKYIENLNKITCFIYIIKETEIMCKMKQKKKNTLLEKGSNKNLLEMMGVLLVRTFSKPIICTHISIYRHVYKYYIVQVCKRSISAA